MKKILFGITSLGLGGAERVLVDLVNRISNEYEITVFTIYGEGELEKELNSNVKLISMNNKSFNKYNKLEKVKISLNLLFKQQMPQEYDIYVAFLEGPITRLFSKVKEKKYTTKKIAWIHNDISKVFGTGLKAKIKKWLDKKIYKKYDNVVFVSEENKEDFEENFYKINNCKIVRNYLDYTKVLEKAEKKEEIPFNENDINLVTVCRLVEQKAIDRFIKIHNKLENEGIHSKVYIVGDGPLRYKLQKQIDSLNETENFFLLGPKENPYPYIKKADYFCLLSYFEGYGMVLDEAKILNKTVIITDIATKESIQDYDRAIILDNTEKGIYEGLKKVLTSDNIIDIQFDENRGIDIENVANYYENIIKKIYELFELEE